MCDGESGVTYFVKSMRKSDQGRFAMFCVATFVKKWWGGGDGS